MGSILLRKFCFCGLGFRVDLIFVLIAVFVGMCYLWLELLLSFGLWAMRVISFEFPLCRLLVIACLGVVFALDCGLDSRFAWVGGFISGFFHCVFSVVILLVCGF